MPPPDGGAAARRGSETPTRRRLHAGRSGRRLGSPPSERGSPRALRGPHRQGRRGSESRMRLGSPAFARARWRSESLRVCGLRLAAGGKSVPEGRRLRGGWGGRPSQPKQASPSCVLCDSDCGSDQPIWPMRAAQFITVRWRRMARDARAACRHRLRGGFRSTKEGMKGVPKRAVSSSPHDSEADQKRKERVGPMYGKVSGIISKWRDMMNIFFFLFIPI